MSEFVLNAESRQGTGKQVKRNRLQGRVPGVYYMRGEQNINIEVETRSLDPLIYTSKTHIIELKLKDGQVKKCILRDVQFDPVSDRPIHFDLQGLRENEKLTVEVPVILTGGTPAGVKDGGMLQHFIHKLRVSCLPKDIPEQVEVNVASLGINHFVHVRDLTIPNVTMMESMDSPVAGVMPPHLVKEAEAVPTAEEEAAKEPEVIGKGKKAEEGEEGAEAPAKGEAKPAAKAEAKPAAKEDKKEKK